MMICTNCMSGLPEDAKYCFQCGQPVHLSKDSYSAKPIGKSKPFTRPSQAFALILAALAISILIVIMILDSNQKNIAERKLISTNTSENSKELQVQLEKLSHSPESIPLNIEIGNLLFDSGRFDEATSFYQKALTLNPKNIAVQIDLAVCFFNMRRFDQSILEMNKALEIDPNHPKGLYNMGIIYFTIGNFDKAREYWQHLIAIDPELTESQRANEMMNKLN